MAVIKIGAGLALLIAANIALGSVNAIISGSYDKEVCRRGIIKGIVVLLSLVAVYLAGWLNPDLLVVEAGSTQVNLMTGVNLLLLAAYTTYSIDVLKKLKLYLIGDKSNE